MARVTIRQLHRALIEQEDTYDVPDDKLEELHDTSDEDRERWVMNNGQAVDTSTEVESIQETIDVEVTW